METKTPNTITLEATPLTKVIVETWLKPKLTKIFKGLDGKINVQIVNVLGKFDEYILRSYEKYSYLTVIVFQNQQQLLKDIYLPLHIYSAKGRKTIKIDEYKEKFIPSNKKVLITDSAGMGKSTVMKFMFLSCVETNKGIPIFIELRKLSKEKKILDIIFSEINLTNVEFDKEFILNILKQGNFVFFLDGYDEIPFNQRTDVTRDIQDFISKTGKNYFILTSRPESSLMSFPDFQKFHINPLKTEEAYELIRKYDRGGDLSREIISKLAEPTFRNINEFLTNPLLVSLLYKSYEYKPILHFKKHLFYRQVYDSLFESHDLSKGDAFVRDKFCNLDIDEFHRILRALGFITVKLGQIEFDRDKLLLLLDEVRDYCPNLHFRSADFLEDLIKTVPLFNKEGNFYRWAHKSIQEYFAAQFICIDAKGKQDEILNAMYKSDNIEKYYNVLDLCYDIDYKSFRRTIIYSLICEFMQYYNSSYIDINRQNIDESDIHERKLLTFGSPYFLCSRDYIRTLFSKSQDIELKIAKLLNIKVIPPNMPNFALTDLTMFYPDINEKIPSYLFIPRNRFRTVLNLLRQKRNELVKGNNRADQAYQGLKRLKPYIIEDLPTSEVNKPVLFKKINQLLSSFGEITLNFDNCISVKTEVENELDKENSNDFLIKDI